MFESEEEYMAALEQAPEDIILSGSRQTSDHSEPEDLSIQEHPAEPQ